MAPAPTTWVLSDGRAGNERQALALSHALSAGEPRIWRLAARAPWKVVAPRKWRGSERAFGEEYQLALREPPYLAVGCGRQAALATRLLHEAGAKSVQILDPRIDPRHWDAVVVPAHDRLRGANVVATIGSLHEVDAGWLASARARFASFEGLRSPRTVLLLGGPIRSVPLDPRWWRCTVEALRAALAHAGGSLSVCASPRTPAWLIEAARRDLRPDLQDPGSSPGQAPPGARWLGPEDGPNPYAGLLAWAERIVVSPDSVNMISESCATTARVSIASPERARGRHARFLQSLAEAGRTQSLASGIGSMEPATPLIDLPRTAAAVRAIVGD
jgi:mitochondrial fission protein ELM1